AGGFSLKNKRSGLCMDIIKSPTTKKWQVMQSSCNSHSNQSLSFGIPKSPLTWKSAKKETLKGVMKKEKDKDDKKVKIFNAGRYDKASKKWQDLALACRIDLKGQSLIGMVSQNGDCRAASEGKVNVANSYQLLTKVDKPEWVRAQGGSEPFDAIESARHGLDIFYTCRTVDGNGGLFVGWAYDGSCRYANGDTTQVAAQFDYLISK
ncbi:MAG: RICIN domain-containing protein, partial [Rhodospirillaceae bacterium]|nr:RICIN domain-containing protein [Rhodospirillaceae bacterium]